MIEGNKITLRDFQLADLAVYEQWQQPGQRWQEFDAPDEPDLTPAQIEQQLSQLQAIIEAQQRPFPRQRLVIAHRTTDLLLGTVSWYGETETSNWPKLGIGIYDPQYWRQGIGYEALGLWCDYLWQGFPNAVRLGLSTWSGNRGMIALAQKLGFQQEACIRRARIVNDRYYDSVAYGILRQEWRKRYPAGFAAQLPIT
jgi:RimJ/RimL family protein N-acetyltransferase